MTALLNALRTFGSFWYDFVVGDDWRVALGVVVSLAATFGLVAGRRRRWLPPVAVVALLALSLRRVVRDARRG